MAPVQAEAPAATAVPTEATPAFSTPLLITDGGQGNNAKLIQAMLRRSPVSADKVDVKEVATEADLDSAKTLVIGVGASTKGLGAAGLDAAQETSRLERLIAAAKEKRVPIVGIHMGGEPRRGELSDGFNRMVFEGSDVFIVWEGGNADGFFTRLAERGTTRLVVVQKKSDVGTELVNLLPEGKAANQE
jgi:hypothetical protein